MKEENDFKLTKDDYIKIAKEKLKENSTVMIDQIERYYKAKKYTLPTCQYKVGDDVKLLKGTLLHGTYKNLDGLKEILKDGLISSWFIDGRISKYPSSVGLWNLKQDYMLKDYINFYSGGTIKYSGLLLNNEYSQEIKTDVIPFSKMPLINDIVIDNPCRIWNLEQTKEARFMPSLVQNQVQIGIIFNGNNIYSKELLKGDILNPNVINDIDVKEYVNENYYERFIIERKEKDDFFTDRESAIIFGIPANLIEGILVGRQYERDNQILNEIKSLLPNCYICNIDGKVIK